MAALCRLVDPSHILFGSDFPFAPEPITALQVQAFGELSEWNEAMQAGVARHHALALFPRYASPGETASHPTTRARRANLLERAQGAVLRSAVRFIDHIRQR